MARTSIGCTASTPLSNVPLIFSLLPSTLLSCWSSTSWLGIVTVKSALRSFPSPMSGRFLSSMSNFALTLSRRASDNVLIWISAGIWSAFTRVVRNFSLMSILNSSRAMLCAASGGTVAVTEMLLFESASTSFLETEPPWMVMPPSTVNVPLIALFPLSAFSGETTSFSISRLMFCGIEFLIVMLFLLLS